MKQMYTGKFRGGYYTGATTPYKLTFSVGGTWRIGFGRSSFLVAQGAPISRFVGVQLYRDLENRYWQRVAPQRPAPYKPGNTGVRKDMSPELFPWSRRD